MKSRDGIIGLHCFDSTKNVDTLDPNLKPEALRMQYHVDLTMKTAGNNRFRLLWIDKEGDSTDMFILKTVNEICFKRNLLDYQDRPSYFITGMTGRKEVNKQKKVGTLPKLAAGLFLIPNIIIKLKPITDRPRVFVCAIKSLEHIEPYNLCLDLAKPGNGDKVYILHVYNNESQSDEATTVGASSTSGDKGDLLSSSSSNSTTLERIEKINQYFTERIQEDGLSKSGSKFVPIPNTEKVPTYDTSPFNFKWILVDMHIYML
jgi:hypothetical protein